MNTIYTLSTCDTSKRILKPLPKEGFKIVDIKKDGISKDDLDRMYAMTSSYESLFSRRSRSYIAMGLKNKELSENDIRDLILSDYTFLKRPVIIVDDKIFVGNQKKNVAELYQYLGVNE